MTRDKNPYESQETVDIPDFLEKKNELEETYNEEIKEVKNKKVGRKVNEKVLVVGAILIVALLLLSLISLIYALNQKNAYQVKETEYQELLKASNEKELKYQEEIKKLQTEVEQLKAGNLVVSNTQNVDKTKETKYVIDVDVINVRNKPTTKDSEVTRQIEKGKIVSVYGELQKDSDGNSWGQIGDNEWICIVFNGTTYAKISN